MSAAIIDHRVACLSGLAQQQQSAWLRPASAARDTAYLSALGYLVLLSIAMWGFLVAVLPGR